MEMKTYLNEILGGINKALKECDYETCKKNEAHIILELNLEYTNITLYLRKK